MLWMLCLSGLTQEAGPEPDLKGQLDILNRPDLWRCALLRTHAGTGRSMDPFALKPLTAVRKTSRHSEPSFFG